MKHKFGYKSTHRILVLSHPFAKSDGSPAVLYIRCISTSVEQRGRKLYEIRTALRLRSFVKKHEREFERAVHKRTDCDASSFVRPIVREKPCIRDHP